MTVAAQNLPIGTVVAINGHAYRVRHLVVSPAGVEVDLHGDLPLDLPVFYAHHEAVELWTPPTANHRPTPGPQEGRQHGR